MPYYNARGLDRFYRNKPGYFCFLDTIRRQLSSSHFVLAISSYSDNNYVCQKCKHIHNHSLLLDVSITRRIHVGPSGTAYYLDTLHLNDETHTDIVKRLLKRGIKINSFPSPGQNALMAFFPKEVTDNWGSTAMTLYSAGVILDYKSVLGSINESGDDIHKKASMNNSILFDQVIDSSSMDLKHLSRKVI